MIFYKVGPGLTDPARLHSSLVMMLRPVGSSTLAVVVSGSSSPSSSRACRGGGGGGVAEMEVEVELWVEVWVEVNSNLGSVTMMP